MNRLPAVKRFLKNTGGIDQYEDVEVTWKRGRMPVLIIRHDDGSEKETIPLSLVRSEAKLHALMETKGFRRKHRTTLRGRR